MEWVCTRGEEGGAVYVSVVQEVRTVCICSQRIELTIEKFWDSDQGIGKVLGNIG